MPARTFEINAPFGYKITLQTRVPGTLSIRYQNDEQPAQPQSEPPSEDSTPITHSPDHSSSELTMHIPIDATPTRRPSTSAHPVSPADTEIFQEELTQEEIVVDIKSMGLKVRDFAYESAPTSTPAPEIFNPRNALIAHDAYLWAPNQVSVMSGKNLRRLLSMGWVTEEEATILWPEELWGLVRAHDKFPTYPWRPHNIPKPTVAERRKMLVDRIALYLANGMSVPPVPAWMAGGDVHVTGDIEMGFAEPPSAGSSNSSGKGKKRASPDEDLSESPVISHPPTPPSSKRRRVLGDTPGSSTRVSPGSLQQSSAVQKTYPHAIPMSPTPSQISPPLQKSPNSVTVTSTLPTYSTSPSNYQRPRMPQQILPGPSTPQYLAVTSPPSLHYQQPPPPPQIIVGRPTSPSPSHAGPGLSPGRSQGRLKQSLGREMTVSIL